MTKLDTFTVLTFISSGRPCTMFHSSPQLKLRAINTNNCPGLSVEVLFSVCQVRLFLICFQRAMNRDVVNSEYEMIGGMYR